MHPWARSDLHESEAHAPFLEEGVLDLEGVEADVVHPCRCSRERTADCLYPSSPLAVRLVQPPLLIPGQETGGATAPVPLNRFSSDCVLVASCQQPGFRSLSLETNVVCALEHACEKSPPFVTVCDAWGMGGGVPGVRGVCARVMCVCICVHVSAYLCVHERGSVCGRVFVCTRGGQGSDLQDPQLILQLEQLLVLTLALHLENSNMPPPNCSLLSALINYHIFKI